LSCSTDKESNSTTTPAAEHNEASETISAKRADVRGEEVVYQVGDTILTGYIAYDANQTEQRPGVLVVHEWWGHNEYVRTRAHMLAQLGYTAFALDMYGDGKQATHPDDAQKFMNEVLSQADVAEQRFVAAKGLLQRHNTTIDDQIAAIGYCFGGGVVLQMARNGLDLKGVVSFHGSLGTENPEEEGAVEAKILVLHGADDPFVPAEQVNAFKQEMDDAKADYEFIAYPGAVHAFTNPGATAMGEKFDLPLAYDEEVDQKSWDEMKAFLAEIF
jgi:dienelactone hydrolase